ncbi:MAG: sulfatase [Planctomycetaceae bacterium]|nr:sulfatase [Planctomycetaceae bacterium]MBP63986.1 sulfatase [Planctomycetaceae bacterium]
MFAHPIDQYISLETRRQFFGKAGKGLGAAALAAMLGRGVDSRGSTSGIGAFTRRAKRVIWLFMAGAPSQLDTFDYKPEMADWFNKDLPESVRGGQRLTTMTASQARFPVAPSMFKFNQHGECGKRISELLPKTGSMADELAFIHTMWTEAINHDPAITYIQTGNQIPGRPSLGAWLSYGLGSMNRNLPEFVVLNCEPRGQALYSRLWGSGFLPSKHAGVAFRAQGDPVLYLSNPGGVSSKIRRIMLDRLQTMNRRIYDEVGDPETHTRIAQYEMAFRMQASVPELVDISEEPKHVLELYGDEVQEPGTFASNCLLARRMAERDVRFVQIFHRGWDHHATLPKLMRRQTSEIDRPAWALVTDLKRRGLLDDTLVILGGEFGRTIYCQGTLKRDDYGRDHHPKCYSMWLAGGGISGGVSHGVTDEFGYNVAQDPVHIRDLNATILHLLGIDHEQFTVKHRGLDERLTGVQEKAQVVRKILS